MSFGRRLVSVDDTPAWIFNRMVEAYAARPPYPEAVLDAIASAGREQPRILDLGSGIGHLALPLAERGLAVTAVEPARLMLERLEKDAARRGVALRTVHAKAEELPLPSAAFDLVIIADALHFLDVELAGRELDRVLAPGGVLALLTVSPDESPFMQALGALIDATAARKARSTSAAAQQLFRLARVTQRRTLTFRDATPVSAEQLDAILHSISFVGPAFSAERRQRFRQELAALREERAWARRFELRLARASLRRRVAHPR